MKLFVYFENQLQQMLFNLLVLQLDIFQVILGEVSKPYCYLFLKYCGVWQLHSSSDDYSCVTGLKVVDLLL